MILSDSWHLQYFPVWALFVLKWIFTSSKKKRSLFFPATQELLAFCKALKGWLISPGIWVRGLDKLCCSWWRRKSVAFWRLTGGVVGLNLFSKCCIVLLWNPSSIILKHEWYIELFGYSGNHIMSTGDY